MRTEFVLGADDPSWSFSFLAADQPDLQSIQFHRTAAGFYRPSVDVAFDIVTIPIRGKAGETITLDVDLATRTVTQVTPQ